jgi:hypothetical protein
MPKNMAMGGHGLKSASGQPVANGMWRNLLYEEDQDKFVDMFLNETYEVGFHNVQEHMDKIVIDLLKFYCKREGIVLPTVLGKDNIPAIPPVLLTVRDKVFKRFGADKPLYEPTVQCEVLRRALVKQNEKIDRLESELKSLKSIVHIMLTPGTGVSSVKEEKVENI